MTRQITVLGLLEITALAAITVSLAPVLLHKTSFEVIFALAVALILCAAIHDWILAPSKSVIQTLISLLLCMVALSMAWQWFRYDPRWEFFRFVMLISALLAAARRFRIETRKGSVSLSSIGVAVVVAASVWQFLENRSVRYFVNRQANWGVGGIIETSDGKLALRGGCVNVHLSRPFQRSKPGLVSITELLLNSIDTEKYGKPIAKLRVFSTAGAIDSLSIVDHALEQDWQHLKNMSQLSSLDINRITVGQESLPALRSLKSLRQLAYFDCSLPDNLLASTQSCKELSIVQIIDCTASSLIGLSRNSNIRMLILRGTRLTQADLQEISKLSFLVDLDLRETESTNEEQAYFAGQLVRHAANRRGKFTCKIDYNGGATDGILQLAKSGAIRNLEVSCDQHDEPQLAGLAASLPNVKLLPKESNAAKR